MKSDEHIIALFLLQQFNMKKITFLLFIALSAIFNPIKAATPELTKDFNNVIKTYIELKNALVEGKEATAQANAATLLAAVNKVSDKDMTPAQRKTWKAYADKLSFDSRHISETNAIDHKREHFATLSSNLFVVLKEFKLNTITLYKQYCPMKKFYWVSETASLKNPYYGNAMLTCGENKETLQAAK